MRKMNSSLVIRHYPTSEYLSLWQAMQNFSQNRHATTSDEIWLLEHKPVFTQGLAGKPEHILMQSDIPIVQTDRGGQVTYHGPGQLMCYTLLDLNRLDIGPRELVIRLERVIINLLAKYKINASGCRQAPGVYVNNTKICSIGLRVHRGYCYHGMALNVDMDLSPFQMINPCGHTGLKMTQIKSFCPRIKMTQIKNQLIDTFCTVFGYTGPHSLTHQERMNEHIP